MDNEDEAEKEIWYSKPLNVEWELSKDDQDVVNNVLANETLPSNMAGFIRDTVGQPTLYLTPACLSLAMAIGAHACDKPKRHGLTFYKGNNDAWHLFDE